MRTFADPPLNQCRPDPAALQHHAADRALLIERINQRAARLGTPAMHSGRPIIATGHQAWLWHPGILAKDIAMAVACDHHHAAPLHLTVDQDAHPVWHLELPVRRGDRLLVQRTVLAPHLSAVPTGAQPPAELATLRRSLEQCADGRLEPILDALRDFPHCRTLAEQVAVLLARLMQPIVGDTPLLMVSDLPGLPGYDGLIQDMLHDARSCVSAYNAAVAAVPEAGVPPLIVERERVELPLWAVQHKQVRRRVYADLADSTPWLVDQVGRPIDRSTTMLLPRALLLSAVMRSFVADLFIHGRGGGHYDRATEQWWARWRRAPLAPKAVVSADVHLNLGAPLADAGDYRHAHWLHRYARYNVDRLLKLDGPLIEQKRHLIGHMHADRNRMRRRLAFREIRRINAELVERHPQLIEQTRQQLDQAELGLANARIADRRDWCFVLYPHVQLQALREVLHQQLRSHAGRP